MYTLRQNKMERKQIDLKKRYIKIAFRQLRVKKCVQIDKKMLSEVMYMYNRKQIGRKWIDSVS